MLHLLAYLLIRKSDKAWSVFSYRDLDSLLVAWEAARITDEKSTAIVHVGFWRPNTTLFDSVCLNNEGKVLLSGSAKFSLPLSYRSAKNPFMFVEGLPIYLALSGWGYQIEEDLSLRESSTSLTQDLVPYSSTPIVLKDWLPGLEEENKSLFEKCLNNSILSEALYLEREASLSFRDRDLLGRFRFKQLYGKSPSPDDFISGLQFAPPWLLRLSTKSMDLSVRAGGRLAAISAITVLDIANIGTVNLMRLPGFGKKSLREISEAIYGAFELGSEYCDNNEFNQLENIEHAIDAGDGYSELPVLSSEDKTYKTRSNILFDAKNLKDSLQAAFLYLDEREAVILKQRMGLIESPMTLEQIAKDHLLSRERIRQIESKAVTRILVRMPVWVKRFGPGLAKMLEERPTPLPLVGLEVLDPWFAGVDKLIGPFEYSLEHFIDPPEFSLIRIEGQIYLSRLSQDEWGKTCKVAQALLSRCSKNDPPLPVAEVKLIVESQLVGKGEELRPLLWEVAIEQAHFSNGPSGEKLLVGFGMGADDVVEAVLSESDMPLHYLEITKQCALKGLHIEVRRAHVVASNVAYLLGRGVFGLEKHISLSKEEQALTISETEAMLSETPGRQWHAAEICSELETRGVDFDGRLSKYDLNAVLESSKILRYLGRMVWTATAENSEVTDRLNIWQAVVALVQQHGSPMHASDIRQTIAKSRGLGTTFQIHQADPLIRVGENKWGIIWRDVPFDENQANAILFELLSILKEKGSGLHTSEILPLLSLNRSVAVKADPILLAALAIRSSFVKLGRGGYIYRSEWEGPRRLTIGEAVEKAFDTFASGVLAAEVAKKASEFLGREMPSNTATTVLMKIGYYNPDEGLWFHADNGEFLD